MYRYKLETMKETIIQIGLILFGIVLITGLGVLSYFVVQETIQLPEEATLAQTALLDENAYEVWNIEAGLEEIITQCEIYRVYYIPLTNIPIRFPATDEEIVRLEQQDENTFLNCSV